MSMVFFTESGLTLLLTFVVFYSICLLNFFFLIFASNKESFISLVGLKHLNSFFFFKFLALVNLLALAGLPPLAGFFIKSLFIFFFFKKGVIFVLFFFLFNLASLYFYLSASRSLVLGSSKSALSSFWGKPGVKSKLMLSMTLLALSLFILPFFLDSFLICFLNLLS